MAEVVLNTDTGGTQRAGLEDVLLSVRRLARQTRGLGEEFAGVAERELAMAIGIAEQLRDSVIAKDALEEARKFELMARLRQDVHRAVDLAMDAASAAYVFGTKFVETLIDAPRASISASTSTTLDTTKLNS
jgi:hypothetical protein